jgi:hypothetical protein
VSPNLLALTAALGAAALTAAASLGVVAVQERLRNRKAGNDLRRGAYAGLILALDRLDEICWPLLAEAAAFAPNPPAQKDVLAAAVAVQEAYVAVLLVGSPNARVAANVARLAAWGMENCLTGSSGTSSEGLTLNQLAEAFHKDRKAFIKIAQDEIEQSVWRPSGGG